MISLPADLTYFDVHYESGLPAIWCALKPYGPPRFTHDLIKQIRDLHGHIGKIVSEKTDPKIQFCVSSSQIPGVFNFGGDLPFFVQSVSEQNYDKLRTYAHACVELVYGNSIGWGSDAMTVALVQGDALGGGFESAISHDFIIAERSVKMGMPEIVFNTFPGMGAYSYLCRKLDAAELFDMGLVDVLAEDGEGQDAVRRMISNTRRYEVLRSLKRVRQRVLPLDLQELLDITDIWVDNVMKIQPSDLRRMERLVSAQEKRLNAISQPAG